MKAPNTCLVIAVAVAVLAAVGTWGYSTTHGSRIPVYDPPYRASFDCGTYGAETGRTTLRLVVKNVTRRPIRFRGNVLGNFRLILRRTPDGRQHWRRYATVGGRTPLITLPPGKVYRWSQRTRPILLHGSTKRLEIGSCLFWARPPVMPG